MTNTVTKGQINRSDIEYWDGKAKTTSRKDSTGGTVSGLKFGDYVDVLQVYGGGVNYTRGTINDCINRIGTTDTVTLVFAPGIWVIDDDLTIGSNFTCKIASGCVFQPASGKTLTFSGGVLVENATWTGGSGTVTVSGTFTTVTDFHNKGDVTQEGYVNYTTVSGTDTYTATLSPALVAYVTGAEYRLKFTNANTSTTPTLNLNSLGAKTLKTYDGSVIRVGDIPASGQLSVRYDGTDMILLNPERSITTQTISFSGSISWDLRAEEVAKVTLTDATIQLNNPTNMVDGGTYIMRIIQDATGSRLLTFGTAYRWPNGITPTVAQGANQVSIFTFVSDGTNMDGVMQSNFS